MGRYVARRVLMAIPVLLGASFLLFWLVYVMPGDPIRALAGERPISPATVAALQDEYNLNDPLIVQYLKYLGGFFQGDLGTDFSGREVSETIAQRLPVTVRLALVAIVIEVILGLIAGVLAGIRRGSYLDNLVLVTTTVVVSVPVFVLGFLGQYAFGIKLGWLPIAGLNDGFRSYILPAFILASLSLAYVARLTRTSLVENLRQDYVRTARAKGLKPSVVIGKHTLRNSMIPVVTFIGVDLANLMAGSIVTETVFNIPGLGRAIFDSVQRHEGFVVVGIATIFVFFYITFNLIVDLAYAALDPRIRYD